MIWINSLPVPPSANDMYETTGRIVTKRNKSGKIYTGVKTGRYGSKELEHFKKQCKSFYDLNKVKIDEISLILQDWINQGMVLRLDCYVALERARVWTLDNKAKQIDADNRRKALQDAISSMLNINDKWIFSGIMEKVTCENKPDEQCFLCFTPMKPRTINDIRSLKLKQG